MNVRGNHNLPAGVDTNLSARKTCGGICEAVAKKTMEHDAVAFFSLPVVILSIF